MVSNNTIKEYWSTWLVFAPAFGLGVLSNLTVYVVNGTAPTDVTSVPGETPNLISNVVTVPFFISGNSTAAPNSTL